MRLLSCFLLLALWHTSEAKGRSRRLDCAEFMCQRDKVLLFTIAGNTGQSALAEFDNNTASTRQYPRPDGMNAIPDLFRSSLLDNLPRAIQRSGSEVIVTEMQKFGKVVAKAVFSVSKNVNELDSHKWFTPSRLVQTYPYWTQSTEDRFTDFSVKGVKHNHYRRSFYIHHSHGGCSIDKGLMGIGENSNDGCSWVSEGGQPPILFYATKAGTYQGGEAPVVDYADRFLVYMTR